MCMLCACNLLFLLWKAAITCPRIVLWGVQILNGATSSFLHVCGTLYSSLSAISAFPNKLQMDHSGGFSTWWWQHAEEMSQFIVKRLLTTEDKTAVSWVWTCWLNSSDWSSHPVFLIPAVHSFYGTLFALKSEILHCLPRAKSIFKVRNYLSFESKGDKHEKFGKHNKIMINHRTQARCPVQQSPPAYANL